MLNKTIKALRKSKGLSQQELAVKVNVVRQTISKWEQGVSHILMVTHDAFSASYANRILFLRDGEIYKEIMKGSSSRKEFFEQILEVLNTLGGGVNDVR